MSNKLELQNNNIDLQGILTKVNTLPKKENIDEEVDTIENLTEQIKLALEGKAAGSKIFAAIGVTYPAGSTLTCTNGIKTFTAEPKDKTNSKWVFGIPEPETLPEVWTITATDGLNTRSQNIGIMVEGQWTSIELTFANNLYTSEVTSGWKLQERIDSSGTASISSGKMILDGDMDYGGAANLYTYFYYYDTLVECSANKILNIEVTEFTASAKLIVVNSPSDATINGYTDVAGVSSIAINDTGITSLALPNGNYYIGILYNANAYVEAIRVWIE